VADLVEGGEGALDVVGVAEQRLLLALRGAGDDANRAALPALVEQHGRARGTLALHDQPRHAVAQLGRQDDALRRRHAAGRERHVLAHDQAAVAGNSANGDGALGAARGAGQLNLHGAGLARWRQQ
jgi:hypothetical protein